MMTVVTTANMVNSLALNMIIYLIYTLCSIHSHLLFSHFRGQTPNLIKVNFVYWEPIGCFITFPVLSLDFSRCQKQALLQIMYACRASLNLSSDGNAWQQNVNIYEILIESSRNSLMANGRGFKLNGFQIHPY